MWALDADETNCHLQKIQRVRARDAEERIAAAVVGD